jgi:hypothetical protein
VWKAPITVALAVLWLALTAASATAAAPRAGLLREGQSLGGVRIGWARAQVIAAWGTTYGRCRSCARETLYFNELPFRPQGAGVEFRHGRVVAVFTLWAPAGWRTARGLRIGEPVARATATYGSLPLLECGGYRAIELPGRGTRTVVAIVDDAVWGFALIAAGELACR